MATGELECTGAAPLALAAGGAFLALHATRPWGVGGGADARHVGFSRAAFGSEMAV
jgi:hypothetical protein